ncbi:HK97 family phage prohead protease [Ancylobacter sp. 3268]|uniref:prohead protease/major capsid protein fusion protein n=1 Tax=Ancylobacter sp. 3268 TaxID=2817752 RepID=UPI0028545F55|nr:prohead protease/major capsid protein fusion protein [Ancylobacter sp. 3268]MDR6952301.1 HK97 family phage prohead protease [Ancylobacter sp. 3268]
MRRSVEPRTSPDGFEPGAFVHREANADALARIAPATYDERARTVTAIFSTGSRVRRWGIFEELAVTPEAIDLSRVVAGQVRLLDSHNSSSIGNVLGVITEAHVASGQLLGTIRFAESDQGREAEARVRSGDLTGLSVGYRVTSWTLTAVENDQEIWRADRWELLEVSLVAVPADPGAMVRAASTPSTRAEALAEENDAMRRNVPQATPPVVDTNTPAAPTVADTRAAPVPPAPAPAPTASTDQAVRGERQRVLDIGNLGRTHNVDAAIVEQAIEAGTTIDAFRGIVLDHLATRADQPGIRASVGRSSEDPQGRREALTEALTVTLSESSGQRGQVSDRARSFMGLSLAEMAAVAIGQRNMPRTGRERIEVLERAFHSTSDFPIIFSGALNARLEAAYAAAQPVYRRIAQQRNFSDFRAHDVIRVGDFPMLKPVTQSGEIQYGSFGEKKETVIVVPYAIAINFTRQMLVNDNLGAIDQILAGQGTTVALFEEVTFFAMKAVAAGVGPTLIEDGKAVFHADHGNLAGAAAAINVASVSLGRAALRKMKRLDGAAMNVAARILLVSPDKETEAEQLVAAVQPQQAGNVNPFSGRLDVVVGGQMTGNAWELYADPAFGTNWQWGLLDGYTAPRIRMDEPFGTQGVAASLEHDFGCGAIDFRFGYRNAGA